MNIAHVSLQYVLGFRAHWLCTIDRLIYGSFVKICAQPKKLPISDGSANDIMKSITKVFFSKNRNFSGSASGT